MTNVNLVESLTVDSSAISEVAYYPNVEKLMVLFISGDSYELTPAELSMYDFIMGCQMTGMAQNEMIKALSWFRKANPEAYMVLLD